MNPGPPGRAWDRWIVDSPPPQDDTGQFRREIAGAALAIVREADAEIDGGFSPRERLIAEVVSDVIVRWVASIPRFRAPEARVTALEIWRTTSVDPWRLALTGVADGNGRIGNMARELAALRADLGDHDTARATREGAALMVGVQRKLIAAVGAAALAVGGGGWAAARAVVSARESGAAEAARIETRLNYLERIVLPNPVRLP